MEKCYYPSAQRFEHLSESDLRGAVELARWRRGLRQGWNNIRVEAVESNGADTMRVGGQMTVKARVNLGNLQPQDVDVQLFHGMVDSKGQIPRPLSISMSHNGQHEGNTWVFSGDIPCNSSGQHGFAVRVLPKHADLANAFEPGLITWG
jgi:starch phosphorylase